MSKKDTWDNFKYPFDSFKNGEGSWYVSLILSDLNNIESVDSKSILYPKNYTNVFYKYSGKKYWYLIVKLDNGYYGYLECNCDNSGKCEEGKIVYSSDAHNLFYGAFPEDLRDNYPDFISDAYKNERIESIERNL